MAGVKRAPNLLGSKVAIDSPANDFLCSNCNYPVFNARQVIGCGCRLCEPCYLLLVNAKTDLKCKRCHQIFSIEQTFRDKASDSELKRRTFPCFYVDCHWNGGALDYREHIKTCEFAGVVCNNPGCDQILSKRAQRQHEVSCQYRKITCEYCKQDVQLSNKQYHELNECQEYVLSCPSGCKEFVKRKKIREHCDRFCTMQTRPCSFMRYGCTAKGKLDVLEKHKRDNQTAHLDMLLKFITDNEVLSPETRLQQDIERNLRKEVKTISDETSSRVKLISEEMSRLDSMLQEMQAGFQEMSILVQTLQATSYNGQFVWKIPEVRRRKQEALVGKTLSLYSAPFFTSRFGYKLCLRLYLNGDGSGKGTHISFFLTIMKGEYDALLPWPFSQMVTLSLLDQNRKSHITQCFKPEPSSSSFWRPQSDMNVASGCPKFAPISILSDLKYVQEDTMFFKVSIDLSGLSQP